MALWITIPVEFFPLDAPAQPVRPLGGLDRGYPDFWTYAARDYGLRVGIYRVMRVLDGLGLRATAIVNAAVASRYPRVVDEVAKSQLGSRRRRNRHGSRPPQRSFGRT